MFFFIRCACAGVITVETCPTHCGAGDYLVRTLLLGRVKVINTWLLSVFHAFSLGYVIEGNVCKNA